MRLMEGWKEAYEVPTVDSDQQGMFPFTTILGNQDVEGDFLTIDAFVGGGVDVKAGELGVIYLASF